MDEESFIIVSAILFCLVAITTCTGVCNSMKHKHTDASHGE
jgi:hypothetical protein